MHNPKEVRTPRLAIRATDTRVLRASLRPGRELEAELNRPVAADWPPLYWDQAAVDWISAKIDQSPEEWFWRPWFISLVDGMLVGTIGFKGPPDGDGFVEIGYSVVESHWRRGIAAEAVGAMIAWALARPGVKGLCAHTLRGDPASSGVLRSAGFAFVRSFEDPTDGAVDRFERVGIK